MISRKAALALATALRRAFHKQIRSQYGRPYAAVETTAFRDLSVSTLTDGMAFTLPDGFPVSVSDLP